MSSTKFPQLAEVTALGGLGLLLCSAVSEARPRHRVVSTLNLGNMTATPGAAGP